MCATCYEVLSNVSTMGSTLFALDVLNLNQVHLVQRPGLRIRVQLNLIWIRPLRKNRSQIQFRIRPSRKSRVRIRLLKHIYGLGSDLIIFYFLTYRYIIVYSSRHGGAGSGWHWPGSGSPSRKNLDPSGKKTGSGSNPPKKPEPDAQPWQRRSFLIIFLYSAKRKYQ